MKSLKHLLAAAVAFTVFASVGSVSAQGFDRNELMKRMADRMREQLKVENDDEWSIISERLMAVVEARFAGFGGRGGPGGFSGRTRGGGFPGRGGDRGGDRGRGGDREGEREGDRDRSDRDRGERGGDRGGDRGRGPGFGGDPDSARGKLAAAIQANASAEEIKKLLSSLRAEREASEAKLKQAQAALREVVTQRQEAILVLTRMLD